MLVEIIEPFMPLILIMLSALLVMIAPINKESMKDRERRMNDE